MKYIFDQHFWWMRYLEMEMAPFGQRRRGRLLLYNPEIGKYVAQGDSILEMNELAEQYMHKLFEEIVLNQS